jgi:choice-of-anchor B domain-containing protein
MRHSISLLFCTLLMAASLTAQQNHHLNLLGQLAYPGEQLSSLWGYEAPDGTPYAIVGTDKKVSIVSLANPAAPLEVASVPGPTTIWREVKVRGHYAYISLDNVQIGMQIIDLSGLPASVAHVNWNPSVGNGSPLSYAHTVTMDENGILIVNGANNSIAGGAPLLFDTKTDPMNPTYLGAVGNLYCHDSYARGDTLYAANINEGHFAIWDITNKANPVELITQNTPSTFTHNIWPTSNSNVVLTTDEVGDSWVTAYDISDLNNIKELDRWQQTYAPGSGKIPHNVHMEDDFAVLAHYSDGTIVLDAHRPSNLIEVARYDSHPQTEEGFVGVWGTFPYFAQRDWIISSDMQNGLVILQPTYQLACYLEGRITDAVTGLGLNGSTIRLSTTGPDLVTERSKLSGNYGTGMATAGTYNALFTKPGYFDKVFQVQLVNGEVRILDVQLESKPNFIITGLVKDADTGLPIADATVRFKNADFDYLTTSNTAGTFQIPQVFAGDYQYFAGKWGYSTEGLNNASITGSGTPYTFLLSKGYKDPFALDLGWTNTTSAFFGEWELAKPVYAEFVAGPGTLVFHPGYDVTTDLGDECYVTSNLTGVPNTLVLGGVAVLESPVMDLTGYVNPKLRLSTYYIGLDQNTFMPPPTKLRIKMLQGASTKTVYERTFSFADPVDWKHDTIAFGTLFTPGPNMKLRIEIGATNQSLFFDGSVDDFEIINGTTAITEPFLTDARIEIAPNPTSTVAWVRYQLPEADFEGAQLILTNTLGQTAQTIAIEAPQGEAQMGAGLEPGVYLAQIRMSDGRVSRAVRLMKI